MIIKNHLIEGAPFNQAKNINGIITPTIIVVHDTASSLTKGAAAKYLRNDPEGRKVSVHIVVERDGTYEQQVPFNKGANHAGKSVYNGRQLCNGFSIGIEIVNPGVMTKGEGNNAVSYGKSFDMDEYKISQAKALPNGGMAYWMGYTPEQITTVQLICRALVQTYPTIKDIVPHWFISPGRKVDTNPLFPLELLRKFTFGDGNEPTFPVPGNESPARGMVKVLASGLNLRRWPSMADNVLAVLPHGTQVPIIKQGNFKDANNVTASWLNVSYSGTIGWIKDDRTLVELVK